MAAHLTSWGGRATNVLQGITLERPVTTLRNTVSEVVTVPFTPLIQGEQVRVARALRAKGILDLTSDGNLLASRDYAPLPPNVERAIARLPEVTYSVEVHWDILRKHPRIFSVSPLINALTRPQNRHLYVTPHPKGTGAQALCVYPPHYGLLDDPKRDEPHRLLLWIAAYLACDAIQHCTGLWLGAEASHSRKEIQKRFGSSECWCGSGIPMAHCHGPAITPSPMAPPPRRRTL